MRRPPSTLVFLSVLLLALGTTGGAAMSFFRGQIQQYTSERIFAARAVHSLSGSRDYDADVVAEIVFSIEAGLSFFHTHGEGIGLLLLFAATLVASLIGRRWVRAGLYWLVGLSALFPIGYLAYSALILVYGKDAGISLAERFLLIPFGSSAILGLAVLFATVGLLLVNGRLRHLRRAAPAPAAPGDEGLERGERWRRPPRLVVLAAALLIAMAEIGGAAMGRFNPEIDGFTAARVRERAEVHGLVGVSDVDNEIIDEVTTKLDSSLRLFHLHAEGLGLMVFGLAVVIATDVRRARFRRALHAVVALGGFSFPLGYLLWSALIPLIGVDRARTLSATFVLVPTGGVLLVGLWSLTVLLAGQLLTTRPRDPAPGPNRHAHFGPEARAEHGHAMRLPPVGLVLASVLLLVIAGVGGGAMVKFKTDLDRAHRAQIEARPLVHGIVGVRQIDGPRIDTLLSRADFALRLFHLHGEGIALVMLAGGLMVRNFIASRPLAGALHTLLAVGGFLYPFGYLAWGMMIPRLGLQPSRALAEWFLWVPFGGAVLLAMALIALVLTGDVLFGRQRRGHG